MYLPKDPVMMLSVVNTALRDHYSSLEALCDDTELSESQIKEALSKVGYSYDENTNQFK